MVLSYLDGNGVKTVLHGVDSIVITPSGRERTERVVVGGVRVAADGCDINARGCSIEAEGCHIEPVHAGGNSGSVT